MLNVNIFGSYDFRDLPNIPVASLDEGDIFAASQAFIAAESAALDLLMGTLADFGQTVQESFGTVQGGQLQPIGEFAGPEAVREGGKWAIQFPIRAWGTRSIYTREYLKRANLQDINQHAAGQTLRDINTVFSYVFGALTGKSNYTHDDDEWPGTKAGPLTIRRLANADGQVGFAYANGANVALATTNNYITSGAASYAIGAFTTARDKLRATGNAGDLVHIVSVNDGLTLGTALGASFIPVPDPKLSILPTTQTPLVESPRAIGRVRDAGEVQTWPHWPDGYMFTFDRSKDKPLRIRQSQFADERGFQLIADETRGGEQAQHPLVNRIWRRIMGCAVRNRFNGVMTQITASGTYTDPVPA